MAWLSITRIIKLLLNRVASLTFFLYATVSIVLVYVYVLSLTTSLVFWTQHAGIKHLAPANMTAQRPQTGCVVMMESHT